jgi:hypothetical protein
VLREVSASVGDYFFVVVYWPAAGGSVKKPLLVLIALVLILVGGTFYYFVISYFGQDLLGRVIALPGTIAVIVGCVLLWEQTKTVLEPFRLAHPNIKHASSRAASTYCEILPISLHNVFDDPMAS